MILYTKDADGNESEVNVDDLFKDRKERWVKTETAKMREEVEKTLRDELTTSITKSTEDKVRKEFQTKLDDATAKNTQLETTIRQKTIAAEYGFKPGTEKYLGTGTEEEMRKEADNLKNNFGAAPKAPEKQTGSGISETQKRTGIHVDI